MKEYRTSFARANEYKPPHPERTARRNMTGGLEFDVIFGEFTNRAAMLKTIELQGKSAYKQTNWKACIQ